MKRVRYFDLLRVICFCMIIFYHMMLQLHIDNIFTLEMVNPYIMNANMHIATLSVAVFFMLSGASLTVSTKDPVDYKRFYIRRLTRLMLPFYFVNICCFIIRIIVEKSVFELVNGIAPWKIILGIAGIDGWLRIYGVSSFSQGIGEWFLGCILILYLLYPLFRKLMLKNEILFLSVVISIYVMIIYNYSSSVPIHQSIFVKGCEFIFGMYLGKYWGNFDKKLLAISLPVVVFYFTSTTPLSINSGLNITIFALAFFVTFSFVEDILQSSTRFYKWISIFSGCSYELFLIHHIVIYYFTSIASQYEHNIVNVLILFVTELAVMAVLTVCAKVICDNGIERIRQKLQLFSGE